MIVVPPSTWQDTPRNQTCDQLVELRDVMPTVLNAARINVPATCDGLNMMPLATGQQTAWRKHLQGEHCKCYAPQQANLYVVDDRYKYIWFPYTGNQLLFDLQNDPGECKNLAAHANHQQTRQAMQQQLTDILRERGSHVLLDHEQQLRKLDTQEVWQSPNYEMHL